VASFFEQVLLRLKEQLQMQSDKEIAAVLGMSPTAFNDRKKRDVFPEEKLLAMSVKRPDLKLDVTYILTGERVPELTRQQLAVTNGAVGQIGDTALTTKLLDAHKKLGAQQAARLPSYKNHLGVLDHCADDDVEMVMRLAVRLATAPLPKKKAK
jgi:Bacteriophage CI repressor helix-turn-helix domain